MQATLISYDPDSLRRVLTWDVREVSGERWIVHQTASGDHTLPDGSPCPERIERSIRIRDWRADIQRIEHSRRRAPDEPRLRPDSLPTGLA